MPSESRNAIITPEAVVLEFETAGLGSRVLARFLDLIIIMVILSALQFVAAFASFVSPTAAIVLMLLIYFVVFIGYPILFEGLWNGRTVGKVVLGLRVVTRDGAPVRMRHAAIRGIIGLGEVFALPFVGVLSALTTRANQRVGDLAAGTIVVRDRTVDTSAVSVSFPAPYGFEQYTSTLDVSPLGAEQYGVVRSFLMRVLQLTPQARAALAVRLANATALRLRHQPPPTVSAELFLVCVASAYQHRHGAQSGAYGSWAWPPPPGLLPPPPGAGPPGAHAPVGAAPMPAFAPGPGPGPGPVPPGGPSPYA